MGRGAKVKRTNRVRKDKRRSTSQHQFNRSGKTSHHIRLPPVYDPDGYSPRGTIISDEESLARLVFSYMKEPGYKGNRNPTGGVFKGLKRDRNEVSFESGGRRYYVRYEKIGDSIREVYSLQSPEKTSVEEFRSSYEKLDPKNLSMRVLGELYDRILDSIKVSSVGFKEGSNQQ